MARKDPITFIKERGLYEEYRQWVDFSNVQYQKRRYADKRFEQTHAEHGKLYAALMRNGISFSPVKKYIKMKGRGRIDSYKIHLTYLDKTISVFFFNPDDLLCNIDFIFQSDHLSTVDLRLMQCYATQQEPQENTSTSTDPVSQ